MSGSIVTSFVKSSAFALGATGGLFVVLAISDDKRRQRTRSQFERGLPSSWRRQLHDHISFSRSAPPKPASGSFVIDRWNALSPIERTLYGLIGTNAIVFLGWQIPRLQPFMFRHFTTQSSAFRGLLSPHYTLFTSVFSHSSFLHFACNMTALYSFGLWIGPMVFDNSPEHFLFVYLAGGLWSSVMSASFRLYLRTKLQSLFPRSPSYSAPHFNPSASLGASGAICNLLGMAAHFPSVHVGLIFLPFLSVPAPTAVLGLAAFDLYGLVSGRFSLDHVAHLTGSALGYTYYSMGRPTLWQQREKILARLGYHSLK